MATPEQMGYYLGGGYLNYPVGYKMDAEGHITSPTKINGNGAVPSVHTLRPSVSTDNLGSTDNGIDGLTSSLFGALKHNALLSAGISGGLGVANNLLNLITGGLLQKKQWEREDTAHQREVADLKAAGLSPVLSAGGSGLGSSSSTMSSYKPNLSEIPAQSIGMYSNVLSLQRQAIENMILSKDLSYKDSEIIRKWIGTIFGKI